MFLRYVCFVLLAVPISALSTQWRIERTPSNWAWDVKEVQFYSTPDCSTRIQTTGGSPINSGNAGGSWGPQSAFDNNQGSAWGGRKAADGIWVGYKFSTTVTVKCVKVLQNAAVTVTVQFFDGANWEAVGSAQSTANVELKIGNLVRAQDRKCQVGVVGAAYDVSGCQGSIVSAECTVRCKAGFLGQPAAVCLPDGKFEIDGCYSKDQAASTEWRLRRKDADWKWDLPEAEFFSDAGCTKKIAVTTPVASGGNGIDAAFDGVATTKAALRQDAEKLLWIGGKWGNPKGVLCVKAVAPADGTGFWVDYLDNGVWKTAGGGNNMVTNLKLQVLPRPFPMEIPRLVKQELATSLAPELPWVMHDLAHTWAVPVPIPRRMFTATCAAQQRVIVGFTTVTQGTVADPKATMGHLSIYDQKSGPTSLVLVHTKSFPECKAMYGVAVSADCSAFYALCRGNKGMAVKEDWIAVANNPVFLVPLIKPADYMYLYSFGNSILNSPTKYICSKGQGSWEYGNALVAVSKDTIVIALKQFMCNNDRGDCHEGESAWTVDLATMKLDLSRSMQWATTGGHVWAHRLVYNEYLDEFLVVTGSDAAGTKPGTYRAWSRVIAKGTKPNEIFMFDHNGAITPTGGAGSIVSTAEGWIVSLVTRKNLVGDSVAHPDRPTSIGVVRLDKTGAPVGAIHWAVENADAFLGVPQIAVIGAGKYLLGWGEMNAKGTKVDLESMTPSRFLVAEVDGTGKLTGPIREVDGGWGEQDSWITVGGNTVLWPWTWTKWPTTGKYEAMGYPPVPYTGSKTLRIMALGTVQATTQCRLPTASPGYSTARCDTTAGAITAFQCTVSCAPGYHGNANVECGGSGTFDLTGCTINTCSPPQDSTGYDIAGCAAGSSGTGCVLKCASGFSGIPSHTCPSNGGTWVFDDCFDSTHPVSDQYRLFRTDKDWKWGVHRLLFFKDDACSVPEPTVGGAPIQSGSYDMGYYGPAQAFTDNNAAWGGREDAQKTLWIGYQFPKKVSIRCVKAQISGGVSMLVEIWDGKAWSKVGQMAIKSNPEWTTVTKLQATAAPATVDDKALDTSGTRSMGWRLRRKQNNWIADIGEVQFYGDSGCTAKLPTPGAGAIGSASCCADWATYVPSRAFDGNDGTVWGGRSKNQALWVGYRFPELRSVKCVKVKDNRGDGTPWVLEYEAGGAWHPVAGAEKTIVKGWNTMSGFAQLQDGAAAHETTPTTLRIRHIMPLVLGVGGLMAFAVVVIVVVRRGQVPVEDYELL
eukprot:NODE_16_length_4062_cov_51.441316_g12_i0.p1 GENE.NODE_16_length_4062_cov_51.441316_g12_i0~~NODE_16_length_4062_cov_51.441316_g12_i0.p1  ORF type:complete len:1278 (-),score=345.26 NODE_16_length_4062_cov_51.441316_g12_i0:229-4008(-)